MGNTVYAENMGFFHKGSGGKGVAPGDACLSPPPPPGGPMPVPYVNMLQASDLAKGSKTVKIMGEPTALENASYISTSTGNEAGTQGGGVVTHKTKGKGSFKLWSFVVTAEGKGVCRHGDPMEQNTASPLPNCVDASALESINEADWVIDEPCEKAFPRDEVVDDDSYEAQKESVRGGPCWQCGRTDSLRSDMDAFTPDHQPPLSVVWYLGGCHNEDEYIEWANDLNTVKPHCGNCSMWQGLDIAREVRGLRPDYAAIMRVIKSFLGI